MTEKSSVLIRLDAYLSANWTSSEIPVAILNIESTLHDRIAYCWGVTNQLHVLSDFLCEHDNTDIRQLAALFGCQLQPLKVVLQQLGNDTQPSEPSGKT